MGKRAGIGLLLIVISVIFLALSVMLDFYVSQINKTMEDNERFAANKTVLKYDGSGGELIIYEER